MKVFIDMDNVLVDFQSGLDQVSEEIYAIRGKCGQSVSEARTDTRWTDWGWIGNYKKPGFQKLSAYYMQSTVFNVLGVQRSENGDLQFRVIASENTRLKAGDTFECSLIIEGEPLYLDHLKQTGQLSISYVCGKLSGVFFEYV